jgi:hypothetical protein
LAADSQLVKKMGQAGHKYLLSNFTPELIAKQYSEVFHEAVGAKFGASRTMNMGQVRGKSLPIQKKI